MVLSTPVSVSTSEVAARNADRFRHQAGLNGDIHPQLPGHVERDVIAHELLEPRHLGSDLVLAGGHEIDQVISRVIALDRLRHAGADIGENDYSIGHDGSRWIGHGAADTPGANLAVSRENAGENRKAKRVVRMRPLQKRSNAITTLMRTTMELPASVSSHAAPTGAAESGAMSSLSAAASVIAQARHVSLFLVEFPYRLKFPRGLGIAARLCDMHCPDKDEPASNRGEARLRV